MYCQPRRFFSGKVYPPKSSSEKDQKDVKMYSKPRGVPPVKIYPTKRSPGNAKLLEKGNAPIKIRIRPISAPTKIQPLEVEGKQSEIHHGTPRRRSQSGGRSDRLFHINQLQEENKSLQEKLEILEKENSELCERNSELWESIYHLEDRLKQQNDQYDRQLRMVLLENQKTQNCLSQKYLRDHQDEEEEFITTTGEKFKMNCKNMETIWKELQNLKRENWTLKHNVNSLQNELENSPSWEEFLSLRTENETLEDNIKSLQIKMKNQPRKHGEEYEKNQWRVVWQRKYDEKEIELKRIQEENRQMKERINKMNQELQHVLKSKSQQCIDLQNEVDKERYHTKEKENVYKSQLSDLNQEMMRMKQKNKDLSKEIDTLKKTAWSTEDEKRELRAKLQRQEAHNKFLNEETARLKKDLINLTDDKKSLLQEKEQYIIRNEEVNKQNTELERQKQRIKSLEMERQRLQSEQESYPKLYQKVTATTEENKTLQNKLNNLERHMRDLSEKKRKWELVIQSLCKQVSEWKTRYHNIEEERKKDLESKSEKEQSYQRQLIMLKEEIKKRTKEKEDIAKEKELLDQTYYETKDILTANLKRQQEYCDAQETEIDRLQLDLHHLQKEKEQLQQQKCHLTSSTVAQNETDLEKLKYELTTEIASLMQKLESVTKEKQHLERELTNLRSRANSQLDTKEQDLSKLRSDLCLKDKLLAGKEKECERLMSKMTTETASLNRNLESMLKEKQDLDRELTNLRARCEQMEDDRKLYMKSKSEREQSSERELSQLKQNIERLQQEKKDLVIEKKRHEENADSRLKTGEQQLAGVKSDLYLKDKLLKEREAELEKLKSRLTSETTSLKREVKSLMEEKQDLENQLTNLRSQYKEMENNRKLDIKSQSQKEQSSGMELKQLKLDIVKLRDEKKELDLENKKLRQKYQKDEVDLMADLKKQKEDNQIQKIEIESLQQNIDHLKKTTEKWQHEKHDLISRHQKEHEETKKLLQSKNHENVSLKTEVQKLKQSIQETEWECQQLQDQNQQLLLKRDSNTQEYQQLSAAAKSENEILQREITRLKKAVSESSHMAKSLADLTDKAEKLEKENIKLETKNQDLNVQIQDLNTRNLHRVQVEKQQKNDLDSKSRECEKYKDELSALKEKMERKTSVWQEEKETHQRKNMQLEKNKQEMNKLELEIQSKENVVKNKQREIEQLQGKMTNIEKEFDKERKALSNKNKELQNQLKDLNDSADSEAQHLQGEIKSKETKISNLESLLQHFESNSSKAQEMEQEHRLREQQLASEIDSLNQRVKQKDDELHQYRRNVDSAIKELDLYRTELDSANNEIRQCRTELDSANNEIQQLRHNNQQKTQRLQSLEQGDYENKSLSAQQRKKIEEQQYIIDKLNKEKDTVIAEIKEVRKRNDDFQQTWQQFQSVLQQKEIENENFASRIRELEDKLRRMSENISTLSKERDKLKQEKDNALTRLSALAGNRLRDNNAAIADLSDENRPISLAEKFSELYDNQWTDALEALENIKIEEKTAIVCLLDLVQVVFEECKKESIHQTESLMKLTGVSPTDRDAMKKLKDFRKSIAGQAVGDVKTAIMNCHQMNAYTKEKPHCTSYINRCIEICWFMQVQDPPVVLDFSVKHGMRFDDKIYKPFTKTGKIVDYVVWPIMLLHEGGPLLQKGVAQPQ